MIGFTECHLDLIGAKNAAEPIRELPMPSRLNGSGYDLLDSRRGLWYNSCVVRRPPNLCITPAEAATSVGVVFYRSEI